MFFWGAQPHFSCFGSPKVEKKWPGEVTFSRLLSGHVFEAFFYSFLCFFFVLSILRQRYFWCRTMSFPVWFWYHRFARMLLIDSKPTSKTIKTSIENRPKNQPKSDKNHSFLRLSAMTPAKTPFSCSPERFGHPFWMPWRAKSTKKRAKKSKPKKYKKLIHFWWLLGLGCPSMSTPAKWGLCGRRPRARIDFLYLILAQLEGWQSWKLAKSCCRLTGRRSIIRLSTHTLDRFARVGGY